MHNIRKTKLHKEFHSLQSVLDEMRPIRYIEHPNTNATISPFIGDQVKTCEAFGFIIPDGYAPEHVVRKPTKESVDVPGRTSL